MRWGCINPLLYQGLVGMVDPVERCKRVSITYFFLLVFKSNPPHSFFLIPTASSASPSLGTRLLRPDLGPHQGGFLPKQVEPYTRVHSSVSARLSLLLSWVIFLCISPQYFVFDMLSCIISDFPKKNIQL